MTAEHRMTRRRKANDYSQLGMYHITLRVADGMGQPLGSVVGDPAVADGRDGAPHVELTPLGQMVRNELLNSIRTFYPMVEVQDYVIMPEHIHFIIEVHETLVSRQGRKVHLGLVIAGFKKGCNRRYWELTGQGEPVRTDESGCRMDGGGEMRGEIGRGGPVHTDESGCRMDGGGLNGGEMRGDGSCAAVCPQGGKVPSDARTGRPVLFAAGYVDVIPLHSGQLQQQREYIKANPRSRLLRSMHRDVLQPQRGGIDTALTVNGLMGYLQRECSPQQFTPEAKTQIESRLLVKGGDMEGENGGGNPPTRMAGAVRTAVIDCDSYGERRLLGRRLLPVVCHRRDAKLFGQQKERCLSAAQEGSVLVSARIAKGEQEIMDETQERGLPVVLVMDNGMQEIYHPSANRQEQCLAEKLLLVTPWKFHYRKVEEGINVAQCKAMNCLVQALCRTKDSWWKTCCVFLLTLLFASCSLVEEDLSGCEDNTEVNYELDLVTNISTEIKTQLETQLSTETTVEAAADIELAHELREYLSGVFTDFAHDVDLSFYDTQGDSLRLQHEQHIMDANQASYTLNLPRRHYMHLAVANLAKNSLVSLDRADRCHTSSLNLIGRDTIDSHTTGVFTARSLMNILDNVSQNFFVKLFMVNCAACLVVDTQGHDTQGMQVYTTGFADGFSICDSAYHFAARPPMVRTHRMETSLKNRVAFCSVNFPSRSVPDTRTVIETTEPFVTKMASESLWEFCVLAPQKDGKVTRTLIHVWQPLMAGQLKIVRVWLNADGSLSTDASEVSTSVTLDWKQGLVIDS